MFAKMQHLQKEQDDLRLLMLREPRGYPASNCNLILPPTHSDADAGFVIMEQVEYPAMSGTNTIAVTTVLIETGMVPVTEPVTELVLESPAGLIPVRAEVAAGKVKSVTFENVPAFAVHLDARIEVPELDRDQIGGPWDPAEIAFDGARDDQPGAIEQVGAGDRQDRPAMIGRHLPVEPRARRFAAEIDCALERNRDIAGFHARQQDLGIIQNNIRPRHLGTAACAIGGHRVVDEARVAVEGQRDRFSTARSL